MPIPPDRTGFRSLFPWILLVCLTLTTACGRPGADRPEWVLAVHGGAGSLDPARLDPERAAAIRAGLTQALEAGRAVLAGGGDSLTAVTAAVQVLEDLPEFNAGRGGVLTADGHCELDAAVMRGGDRAAGAAAGIQRTRNPVLLARDVLDHSPHVLLAGPGTDRFAEERGLEQVEGEYFITERAKRQLERLQADLAAGDGSPMDTVGAVALDRQGNLAAATSTGGMAGKRPGRIGDAPLIGAGTYADNRTCAISATGTGEYFIRAVAAFQVHARMLYQNLPLSTAAELAVVGDVGRLGGSGGAVAVDRHGRVAMPMGSTYMARGVARADGSLEVKLFRHE